MVSKRAASGPEIVEPQGVSWAAMGRRAETATSRTASGAHRGCQGVVQPDGGKARSALIRS